LQTRDICSFLLYKTLESLRNDRQARATAIDNVPVTHDRNFLHKASSDGLLPVALYRASAPCVIDFSMGLFTGGLAAKQPRTGELIEDRPGMLPGPAVLTLAACRVSRFSPLGKNEAR
jgi:hypothetical protein